MSVVVASGGAAVLILLTILVWHFREKVTFVRSLIRRPDKEPVDALAARLDMVTDRLVSATEQLQGTVESLRTGALPRVRPAREANTFRDVRRGRD